MKFGDVSALVATDRSQKCPRPLFKSALEATDGSQKCSRPLFKSALVATDGSKKCSRVHPLLSLCKFLYVATDRSQNFSHALSSSMSCFFLCVGCFFFPMISVLNVLQGLLYFAMIITIIIHSGLSKSQVCDCWGQAWDFDSCNVAQVLTFSLTGLHNWNWTFEIFCFLCIIFFRDPSWIFLSFYVVCSTRVMGKMLLHGFMGPWLIVIEHAIFSVYIS